MDEKTLDLTKLGHQVRFLRNGKGWSLSQLEEKSGISKAYISDVENGVAGRPNIQYVYALAVALGVTLNELLDNAKQSASGSRPKAKDSQLPSGLADLQRELDLTDDDVEALSRVNFRGSRPRDKEGWRFLLEAIKMSSQRKPE
jgi:XRE family transcriptional regulator, regulator of sulfur utilization